MYIDGLPPYTDGHRSIGRQVELVKTDMRTAEAPGRTFQDKELLYQVILYFCLASRRHGS